MDFNNGSSCPDTPIRIGYCPQHYDKYLCWPEILAGTIINQSCPEGYTGLAFHECTSNGTWYVSPTTGKIWTNYNNCEDEEEMFVSFIIRLHIIGYSISLAALLISLWIFITFRSLRCTRIKIHIQLFISFVLNDIAWILHYKIIVPNTHITHDVNPVWCQIFHVAKEYFMVANYMWMFCEGLHLHLALEVVFVAEEKIMKWFYAIGWGISLIIVKMYALYRIFGSKETSRCWLNELDDSRYFISIPVLISLIVSTVFLLNVLRVILTIMHPNSPNPAPMSVRRAFRAALILIPLFGLQYLLLPYTPANKSIDRVYLYTSAIIIPFQGFCVSCIFCFANKEVHHAIQSFIHRRIYRDTRWSNYQYTGATDTAGVYVVNGNGNQAKDIALMSLRRQSTATIRL